MGLCYNKWVWCIDVNKILKYCQMNRRALSTLVLSLLKIQFQLLVGFSLAFYFSIIVSYTILFTMLYLCCPPENS